MSCRERILAVFEGRIPDRVPIMELSMGSKIITNHYGGKLALGLSINKLNWIERIPGWRWGAKFLLSSPKTYKTGIKTMINLYQKMELDAIPAPICLFPLKNIKTSFQ
jgi:hypothetical protein